jgi:Predicted membrane protein (DUF2306)
MNTALKRSGWALMLAGAGIVFVYAIVIYLALGLDSAPDELEESFKARPWGIYIHIIGSMFALIVGPFQFLTRLRNRHLSLHKWMGRIYLTGVLVGGLGGLYVALYAFGGFSVRLAFVSLAALWLFTGFMAYKRIRAKDVQSHSEWMTRSYALTLAAVTLRIWLGIFLGAGIEFTEAYPAIAWFCWVPNLIVAEWLVNRAKFRGVVQPH